MRAMDGLRAGLAAVIAPLLAGGCASLALDVDVYKGPLGNEKGLQLQQAIAMATAAKPLLVALRGNLETEHACRTNGVDMAEECRPGRVRYIETMNELPSCATSGKWSAECDLRDGSARRIHAILSLYEDKDALLPSQLARDLQTTLERHRQAVRRFNPSELGDVSETDRQLVERLKTELGKIGSKATNQNTEKRRLLLVSRLIAFLEPRGHFRRVKELRDAYDPACTGTPTWGCQPQGRNKVERTNPHYYDLRDKEGLAEAIAEQAFGAGKDAAGNRNMLAARLVEIADGFIVARDELVKMFDLALSGLKSATLDERDAYARLVAQLIDPNYLAFGLFAYDTNKNKNKRLFSVLPKEKQNDSTHSIDKELQSRPLQDRREDQYFKKFDLDFVQAIRAYSKNDLKKVIDRIRQAHMKLLEFSRSPKSCQEYEEKKYEKTKYGFCEPHVLDQGLVRGIRRSEDDTFISLKHSVIAVTGAMGLDTGRDELGIMSLTDCFIGNGDDRAVCHGEAGAIRRRLIGSLGRFSETLSSLANNDALLSEAGSAQYVRLLQSIGNTLLVSINDIERYSAGKALRRRAAKDLIDTRIKALEHELISATRHSNTKKKGKSGDSGNEQVPTSIDENIEAIEAAIRAAKRSRNDYIQLRPASDYLRSATPASTLQEGQEGLAGFFGTNHLRGRANCPAGSVRMGRTACLPKETAMLVSELDKQSWVNINRIRLSGSGETLQVLVKDDIGNWYVKGYSTDPKEIMKKLRESFVFGLKSKGILPSLSSGDGEEAPASRLYDRFQRRYEEETDRLRKGLSATLDIEGALVEDLQLVFDDQDDDSLKKAPTELAESLLKPAADELKAAASAEETGLAIIDAIHALHRYRRQLIEKAKGLSNQEVEEEIKKRIDPELTQVLDRRRKLVDAHLRALTILDESLGDDPASSKEAAPAGQSATAGAG